MREKKKQRGAIRSMRSNGLLSYVSYLVIARYKERTNRLPSGLYFNKIMSLCCRDLLDKGIDIGLPHYWYRYGDQVHRYSMPGNIVWNHENPTETKVEWRYEEPLPIHGKPYDLINEVVDKMTDKYVDNEYQAVRDVYNYAPFEFQRKYLDLRELFHGRKNALNWDAKTYKTVSGPIFVNTFLEFSEKSFPELKRPYLVVKKLIESLVDCGEWDFKLLEEVCTNFWFLFCYHLRLKKNCRKNIPRESISYWESEIEFENNRYRRIIGDLLVEIAEKRPDILKNNLLKEEYDWRIKDIEETETMIEEISEDLKGLREFAQ